MRKGRFAPTPSGNLHIGNMGTALLAWLAVRSAGGIFVLRLEDIDRPRCRREYAETIIEDLRWIGIDWDEGPDVGGTHAPYVQSERLHTYEEAMNKLLAAGHLYPCFCSRAKLMEIASAPHGISSEGPVYPGTCRALTSEEIAVRAKLKTPSYRFRMPDKPIVFEDGVYGEQRFAPAYGGDFIVKRADHIHAYQLAVVVDDAAMGITDVLRGADLLDSTPRQIVLYEALGLTVPTFTHIPLLHMNQHEKMSKRHQEGATSIVHMRRAGVRREKLNGWLAFLYGQIEKPEQLSPDELLAHFDIKRVPNRPVILPEHMLQDLYDA